MPGSLARAHPEAARRVIITPDQNLLAEVAREPVARGEGDGTTQGEGEGATQSEGEGDTDIDGTTPGEGNTPQH